MKYNDHFLKFDNDKNDHCSRFKWTGATMEEMGIV